MSSSTPQKEKLLIPKSQSYPGTPKTTKQQVCVNLTDVFQGYEHDITLTPNEHSTNSVYQTALDLTEGLSRQVHGVVDSVNEMENIRNQIQTVLSTDTSPGNVLDLSDTSSVDTIALLKSALPQSSPELQLDENGVLLTSMNSNISGTSYRPHISPGVLDSSLAAENTILKENIEKERCRRKHCEQQIHDLQDKLLESQEQLAVTISTERKKALMIEQLDQTLASVVDGWKKQEAKRIESYNQLKQQNEDLEASRNRQEELLSKFETELAETVDAFNSEQEKLKNIDGEHQAKCEQYEKEMLHFHGELKALQEENLALEEQKHDILQEKQKALLEKDEMMMTIQKTLEDERCQQKDSFEQSRGTENKLAEIVHQLEEKLVVNSSQIDELSTKLKEKEANVKALIGKLQTIAKEKDTMTMELSLMNTKYDALKTRQDSEMRLKLESEFNEQILEIQKQITLTENELRNSQKKQIVELSRRHKDDMEKQKKIFQQDVQRKEDTLTKLRADYEKDLQEAKNQIASLSMTGQTLESQRFELTKRMRTMMHQHWEETVTLLNGGANHPRPTSAANPSRYGHYGNAIPDQLSSTIRSDLQHLPYRNSSVPPVDQQAPSFYVNNNSSSYRSRGGDANQELGFVQPVLPGYVPSMSQPSNDYPSNPQLSNGRGYNSHLSRLPQTSNENRYNAQPSNENQYNSQPSNEHRSHLPQLSAIDLVPQHSSFPGMHRADNYNSNPLATQSAHPVSSQIFTATSENPRWLDGNQQEYLVQPSGHSFGTSPTRTPVTTNHNNSALQSNSRQVRQDYHSLHQSKATSNDSFNENKDGLSLLYEDLDEHDLDDGTVIDGNKQQLGHFIEKLLERSPGQPLDEIPVKDVDEEIIPETLKHEVDHLLRHTPNKQPIKMNPAFKKSIVKETLNNNASSNNSQRDIPSSNDNVTEEKLMHMLKQLIKRDASERGETQQRPMKDHQNSNRDVVVSSSDTSLKKSTKKIPDNKSLQRKTNKLSGQRTSKETRRDMKSNNRNNSAWK